MPIITKPSTVLKGTAAAITLDKSLLAALPIVSGDAYYSVQTNWKTVVLKYKSDPGNQIELVVFDASVASPEGEFLVASNARDAFDIFEIIIEDFAGGYLPIPRSALAPAEFDITFGLPPILYSTRLFSGNYSAPVEGEVHIGNSIVVDSKLYQFGPAIIGTTSYRMLYPKSSNITTQIKSSNLKVRAYVDSIEGSGSYGIYWTDQGTGSALTATTAQIAASVAANGYHEFDVTRIAYQAGGPDYFNLCFDFIGASGTDKIRISKFEIYQQGA